MDEGDMAALDPLVIERAVLNDSQEGSVIAAGFVKVFGDFVSSDVRPILRQYAIDGGQPQLLVNGLAQLLRSTADSIEFPLDHPRAGAPDLAAGETAAPERTAPDGARPGDPDESGSAAPPEG
jgi:hypothetical protein